MRRLSTSALALALCATLAACDLVASAPVPGPGPFDHLWPRSVALLGPDDGWIVGSPLGATPPSDPNAVGLNAVRFTGGTWSQVPTPQPTWQLQLQQVTPSPAVVEKHPYYQPDWDLTKVTFVSADDGWAIGPSGIFHYDGLAWTQVWADSPVNTIGNVYLRGISMDSATDGWAVGTRGILHYTGGHWVDATATIVSVPPPQEWDPRLPYPSLHAVSMVSATDGWAAGLGGTFWHYDGKRWAPAPSPVIDDGCVYAPYRCIITAVQMLSPTEGWAVGGPDNVNDSFYGVIEHYSGGRWALVDFLHDDPNRWPLLITIAMTSPTEGWAGGVRLHPIASGGGEGPPGPKNYYTESFVLHYHDDQWTEVRVPDVCGITGIALSGPEDGWAVGTGGALRLHNGAWTIAFGQTPQHPTVVSTTCFTYPAVASFLGQ